LGLYQSHSRENQYDFLPTASSSNNVDNELPEGIKRCRRCGNGVELKEGCLKMKCLCGYRFCYGCGSENARCSCTGFGHGFFDPVTGRGDFMGLTHERSATWSCFRMEHRNILMGRCKRATCMRRYYVKQLEECSNFVQSCAARVVMRI
jgi:hypothetical protein